MGERECWEFADLGGVDALSTDTLAAAVRARFDSWVMVDCGANCGLFTLNLARKAPGLQSVIAVEPNAAYSEVLRRNLAGLSAVAVHVGAVSDYDGRGRLVAPPYDDNPHGWFVSPDPRGDIAVMRLDSIAPEPGRNLVIKLDIEGDEYSALRGAEAMLRQTHDFVLFVEFHEAVLARTGVTPSELFAFIDAIRPTRWVDAESPEQVIDITRPVLAQTRNPRICDLIGLPEARGEHI
jgi:FkbM family methyltransferase